MQRLSERVRFHVFYEDDSRFGSPASGRFDRELRLRVPEIFALAEKHGLQRVIDDGPVLLEAAMQRPRLAELFQAPGVLREDVLFPEPDRTMPKALLVEDLQPHAAGGPCPRRPASIAIPSACCAELAQWMGEWQLGAPAPRSGPARGLYDALASVGALTDATHPEPAALSHVTLVGHATLRMQLQGTAVLIDPFLFGPSSHNPPNLQPLTASQLRPVEAVFITHSHPDHFDLGSLLRLGADTPIYVPDIPKESLLCIDLEYRLRQLGFIQVRRLATWQSAKHGALQVTAMPFFGEQPTERDALPRNVRNCGNTYWVQMGSYSAACLADAGRDHSGDIQDVALEARSRLGAPDVIFSGHRGYGLYPIQYLFSSTPCYALFVPAPKWSARQRIMCDADEVLTTAELWGASTVVPYADGGAPWFWRGGLGPALDGSRPITRAVDPEPEDLVRASQQRSGSMRYGPLASRVKIAVLRPGHGIDVEPEERLVTDPEWPYGARGPDALLNSMPAFAARYEHENWGARGAHEITASGEPLTLVKKKALLGLLARRHAEELNISPSTDDIRRTSDNFRRRYGLSSQAELLRFFEENQLDLDTWLEIMTDICTVEAVEARHEAVVLARVPACIRVWSARTRGQRAVESLSSEPHQGSPASPRPSAK